LVEQKWEGKVRTGERMVVKEQNKFLERKAMDFSTGQGGIVKGVRVGMRR
jgi:hypothetical protein